MNEQENVTTRKLASIQHIANITPIEGADKIEVAVIKGWECVVKKGEFKVGDCVVYFEVDSILPERPEFEFLRERKFRIKSIRLRKQISQGLVMPLSIIPGDVKYKPEDDFNLTELLGVRKHDPQIQSENDETCDMKKMSPVVKYLMNYSPFRYVYFKLNKKIKGSWPEWISKTDEDRIQNCAKLMMNAYDSEWYITEKLDGQSGTFFTYNYRKWGFNRRAFGVCSRNIWLKSKNSSTYWEVAESLELEKKLLALKDNYVIQGEILAPKVQGNKYKVTEPKLYVFNVIKNGTMLSAEDMFVFCAQNNLPFVPIVKGSFIPVYDIGPGKEVIDVVKYMVKYSQGDSILLKRKREGIVVRLKKNPRVSLKVINPEFLLENDE